MRGLVIASLTLTTNALRDSMFDLVASQWNYLFDCLKSDKTLEAEAAAARDSVTVLTSFNPDNSVKYWFKSHPTKYFNDFNEIDQILSDRIQKIKMLIIMRACRAKYYKEAISSVTDQVPCGFRFIDNGVEAILRNLSTYHHYHKIHSEHPEEYFWNTRQSNLNRHDLVTLTRVLEQEEDNNFIIKANIRKDIKESRYRLLHGKADPDRCQAEIEKIAKNKLLKKLAHTKASRDERSHERVVNDDFSCSIIAPAMAVMQISERFWFGKDTPSQRLHAMLNRHVLDFKEFRKAIGEEWEQMDRGTIDWFPPRIFMKAMIDKMPVLANATRSVVRHRDGGESVENIHRLVAGNLTNLVDIIHENDLIFVKLPEVLIFSTGLYNIYYDQRTLEYPQVLLQKDTNNQYQYNLKSVVKSTYEGHSTVEPDEYTTKDEFDLYTPDMLFYERRM